MQLKTFLRTFNKHAVSTTPVPARFVVAHKQQAPDLFSRIASSLGRTLVCDVVPVLSQAFETNSWTSQLVTTFLGKRVVIALYGLPSSGKRACPVKSFLRQYRGPHYVLYVDNGAVSSKKSNDAVVITIPDKIGVQEIGEYEALFSTSISMLNTIVQAMRLTRPVISLEQLCRIDRYALCLPKNVSDEQLCWLFGDVFEQRSLFQLAQAFFSRDGKAFGSAWMAVRDQFPVQFWLNYFSELVWAGYRYVYNRGVGQPVDAATERKLPFSFTRSGGWRRWNLEQLVQAHALLTHADALIKQGGHDGLMELMMHLLLIGTPESLVTRLQRYT